MSGREIFRPNFGKQKLLGKPNGGKTKHPIWNIQFSFFQLRLVDQTCFMSRWMKTSIGFQES